MSHSKITSLYKTMDGFDNAGIELYGDRNEYTIFFYVHLKYLYTSFVGEKYLKNKMNSRSD